MHAKQSEDRATDRHPVLVKRGHNDVVNSYAPRLAGITEDRAPESTGCCVPPTRPAR